MITMRLVVHTGLILCLLGIGLSIVANQWDGLRRLKLIVTTIMIAYLLVTIFKP